MRAKDIPIYLDSKDEQRFWASVDQSGGPDSCWLWQGPISNRYGRFSLRPIFGQYRSNRVAWVIANRIPIGDLHVCHSCDTPLCCNPAHLWSCTNQENRQDSVNKKRPARMENHPATSLSNEQVVAIINRQSQGEAIRALAREYSVSQKTVQRIVRRIYWRDLDVSELALVRVEES